MKKYLYIAFYILVFFLIVGSPIYFLLENIERQNIATGFQFLSQEAGFEISESIIDYNSFMSYGRALFAGLINTIYVAFIGNVIAFIIGILLGVFSLSKNPLLSQFCSVYLNFFRNVPLILQLFFWYGIFTDILPGVREAREFLGVIISNRGIAIPMLETNNAPIYFIISLLLSGLISFVFGRNLKKLKVLKLSLIFLFFLTFFIIALVAYFPVSFPEARGFNVEGGYSFSPELIALILGLVLYTGAFMGEIVRAGIQAVGKGQWEAAFSLGMTRAQTLKKIILPQSFKVALPPMTAQFLNLTKNSSLAVAIGYPDFVSVANTTMNQTGQAVELVLLIMVLYLITSLFVSGISNLINRKILGSAR